MNRFVVIETVSGLFSTRRVFEQTKERPIDWFSTVFFQKKDYEKFLFLLVLDYFRYLVLN